ncbi:unnamed protein product [Vitrella brassicaformis CCMP3155]|uniref:PPM-type phosphatase domain-containing protein n=1 Tax=Vitrella brassicaformis (strain CCMP3155) TaxID=1169540 RepID=A0A0G4EZG3_VITBC|nr:unnamed protein product [Vitrella brassicaformis CCMP3155]|mmetsp:Transcript_42206/g.105393  ORF Transcript_42206/g.105393 Transcript_42206/m.105393 type:complete len:415 (-) Transcript_42206:38-1282(-)|eukprot:CEM04488.1 unnamed protein product [Vitrella brassicaformis CCMP3155]
MGSCGSKSATDDVTDDAAGKRIADRRRRLSVSQSSEARPVSSDEEEPRGSVGTQLPPLEGNGSTMASSNHQTEATPAPDKVGDQNWMGQFANTGRRLSVSGAPSNGVQRGFDNKMQELRGDGMSFGDVGVGYACRKGLKPESPNQDDFFIYRMGDWALYGVFDGHGPYGHDVSHFVQQHIPKLVCGHSNFQTDPKAALRYAFLQVHKLLEQTAATGRFDCTLSGSTATVALHRMSEHKLWVAHVGDSRCVLGKVDQKARRVWAVDLTNDHKPNLEAEKKRIVASGGQVRRLEGDIPYRVFVKGKLYPGLAMSRALGDTVGSSAGVIAEPEITLYNLDPSKDQFIIMCSDGVWEFISSQEAVDMVASRPIKNVQEAAETLAGESWKRWVAEEGNVVDDITVQVIYLNPPVSSNKA